MFRASLGRTADVCRSISLVLAACLPFLIPFDPIRNIDLQGSVLMIGGGFAWCALLLGYRENLRPFGQLIGTLLGTFAACCLISLLVNPHLGYDFLGAPYVRLGAAGLLSCMGIALLLATVPAKRLLSGLYLVILGLSAVSVPYSWWQLHSLSRIGGVFAQADIFACVLACGLLLGLEILRLYPPPVAIPKNSDSCAGLLGHPAPANSNQSCLANLDWRLSGPTITEIEAPQVQTRGSLYSDGFGTAGRSALFGTKSSN